MVITTELLMLFGGDFLILLLLSAHQKKSSDAALRYHFIAMWISFLMILSGALSALSHVWIFPYLFSVFLMFNAYFEGLALISVADILDPRIRRYLLFSLVFGLVLYSASFVACPYVYIRIMIVSAVEVLILAPPSVMMLLKRKDSSLTGLLAFLFVLLMAVFVIREFDAIRLGPALVLFGPSLGETMAIPGLFAYIMVMGFGIILLCKEKSDIALIRLAYYDEGSAALNRHGFIEEYNKAFEKASYDNNSFVVLIVGLDNLSRLDEDYGPQVADRIIRFVADRLWRLVGKDGLVGRLYGSEFILFRRKGEADTLQQLLANLDSLIDDGKPVEAPFSLTAVAVEFDYPTSKELDFPSLYSICAPYFRDAKKAGPGGRVVKSA